VADITLVREGLKTHSHAACPSVDQARPVPNPRTHPGVDLRWSAKCDNHGGNIQVITAPDGVGGRITDTPDDDL
jgi:hypothetical protein